MSIVGTLAYSAARALPAPVLARLQAAARNNSRTSRAIKRLSAAVSGGAHHIAEGPARGMLIDVAGSRPSYILGTAEPEVQRFLQEHLAPGDVFYDLGANVGYFTLVGASLVGPTGAVRSYEPMAPNVAALNRNIELNKLTNVTVVAAAVSDSAGEAAFSAGPTDQDGRLGAGDLRVRTVSIDEELAAGAPAPSLIKLDVEGAEESAVVGMARCIVDHKPILLCELNEEPFTLEGHPVAKALSAQGYSLRWLEGVGDGAWAPHLVATP